MRHLSIQAKSLVVLFIAIFFAGAVAAIPIAGVESGVADRPTSLEASLSDVISSLEGSCAEAALTEVSEKFADKEVSDEKFNKKLDKKYFKCLKNSLKSLKKDGVLEKDEEKSLQRALKAAKKAAKNGDDDDDTGGGDGTSSVGGGITALDGQPLAEVAVSARAAAEVLETTSDATGAYSLTLASGTDYLVTAQTEGFLKQVRAINSAGAGTDAILDFVMFPSAAIVGAAGGDIVSGTDGAAAILLNSDLTPSQFVDPSGAVVNSFGVRVTSLDISQAAIRTNLPGDTSDLLFFGVVEFSFFDEVENELQLAEGQTAELLLPLYSGLDETGSAFGIGQEVGVYSLDETDGIWSQESSGIVEFSEASPTGLALRTRVSHFSFKAAIPGTGQPDLANFVGFPKAGVFCFDLESLNSGGPSNNYTLGPRTQGQIDVIVLPGTSLIMFEMPDNNDYNFWGSTLTATNAGGFDTVNFFIDNEEFDFDDPNDPLLSCP